MVVLVGILNLTPDSFSDGGQFNRVAAAIDHAAQMIADGAALIDVGAESTRPNAATLSVREEWARLEAVLSVLLNKYPGKISLDTYHPLTVQRAFELGPVIVNDVTGMNNPAMVETVLELKARCIISHLPGVTIQVAHKLAPVKSVTEVKQDLLARKKALVEKGLPASKIILDPGIGFGKSQELNTQLLSFAEEARDHEVMIGYSRKRFLGEHRLEIATNLQAGRVAVAAGAKYLRVHDVAGHRQLAR